MKRLVMWDIDMTLLRSHGVTAEVFVETLAAMTGRPVALTPTFAGRRLYDLAVAMLRRLDEVDAEIRTLASGITGEITFVDAGYNTLGMTGI